MPGSLTVSGMSAGELAGERVFGPITIVGKVVIGETIVTPLTAGTNTFAVPVEAVAAMIIPPGGGEFGLTLRTNLNPSDAGLPLSAAAKPFVYPLPSPVPLTLVFTATSSTPNGISITFI